MVQINITEKAFLAFVTDVANAGSWLTYHTYDSRRSQAGFPDLVMSKNGRVIFAELKTQKGRIRKEQQHWIDVLTQNPSIEVYLWRPSDSDQIIQTLLEGKLFVFQDFHGRSRKEAKQCSD